MCIPYCILWPVTSLTGLHADKFQNKLQFLYFLKTLCFECFMFHIPCYIFSEIFGFSICSHKNLECILKNKCAHSGRKEVFLCISPVNSHNSCIVWRLCVNVGLIKKGENCVCASVLEIHYHNSLCYYR